MQQKSKYSIVIDKHMIKIIVKVHISSYSHRKKFQGY